MARMALSVKGPRNLSHHEITYEKAVTIASKSINARLKALSLSFIKMCHPCNTSPRKLLYRVTLNYAKKRQSVKSTAFIL